MIYLWAAQPAAVALVAALLVGCGANLPEGPDGTCSADGAGQNTNPAQPQGIPAIRGYGALTTGGATDLPSLRHDVCTVTTLEDTVSAGSFRNCVLDRSWPREVRFAVAGTITLSRQLGMIAVRQPYLTINGFSAPPPGITLAKSDECFDAMRVGATHDIVIVGLRFQGLWKPGDPFPNPRCSDPNNTGTLGVDGDAGAVEVRWDPNPNDRPNLSDPGGRSLNERSVRRLILAYNTFANGHDSNPDYWGDIVDATHQGNLVIDSWHPSTMSYRQTSPRRNPRQRISWYANVYARNGERQPQLVNGVYEFDMRDNVIYGWFQPGGGGHGLRFNGFNGDLPTSPVNVVHNALLAADSDPDRACIFGDVPAHEGGADARISAMRIFFEDNLFPEGRHFSDNCVTTPGARDGAYAVPSRARLPQLDWQEVVQRAGMPHRTSREQALLAEIATALAARQPPTPAPSCTPAAAPTPTPPPPTPPPPGGLLKVGYGAITDGGAGGDVYTVTNLNDSGGGSLRNGVTNRSRPRTVTCQTGLTGKIKLTSPIKIQMPYLTLDLSACPGVTVEAASVNSTPLTIAATHDIIVHGVRAAGVWVPFGPTPKNVGLLNVDGDASASGAPRWDPSPTICRPKEPTYRRNSCRIIIDQNTLSASADAVTDFWCGISDLTFSRNLVTDSFQPRGTGCKGVYPESHHHARRRITEYANVYAYNGERQPKLNEGVYNYDLVNNIMFAWQNYFKAPDHGGYATLWDDDGGQERHNVIGNVWMPDPAATQASICASNPKDHRCREAWDCVWGDQPMWDIEDALRKDWLFYAQNVFAPKHNPNECVTTSTGTPPVKRKQVPRPYTLLVRSTATSAPMELVLDEAGVQQRTARERTVIDNVRAALRARLGQ